jgi:hypothetical protein
MEKLKLENRIALLESRGVHNAKIVRKLQRKLRKIQNG